MDLTLRYRSTSLIGRGCFSEVYEGIDNSTQENVAIKTEFLSNSTSQLRFESEIIKKLSGNIGFPQFFAYGEELGRRLLVMELLGSNLGQLIEKYQKFSLKSTIRIGIQLLKRLQLLHIHGLLYRDVKPENFVISRSGAQDIIYIIDFGLCCPFVTPDGSHIPFQEHCPLTGNVRYASLSKHFGFTQGRKDDLESLIYMLIYFSTGYLPWFGICGGNDRETIELIKNQKEQLSVEEICAGLPFEFTTILSIVRNLQYSDTPNYEQILQIFDSLLNRCGFSDEGSFEWHREESAPLSMSYQWKSDREYSKPRRNSNSRKSILARAAVTRIGKRTVTATVVKPETTLPPLVDTQNMFGF